MDKLCFKELIEQYSVVIPMLQRDYAYGRRDEREKRESFLSNLRSYIEDGVPHELDFIYGSIDKNGELTLLDGQQRVTTLFLLHWYLSFVEDESGVHHFNEFQKMMLSNGESRFSYKTRFSSSDFCNAIVNLNYKNIDYIEKYHTLINEKNVIISDAIKREKWFLPHWKYDPTITSMLNMIDSIKLFFDPVKCQNYYKKLIDDKQLTFNFLNLLDFELTDELYIKMNSRGRALTRFENLKSKLLKLYDIARVESPVKYNKKLQQVNNLNSSSIPYNSLRDYVSFMMDTKWTDVFWNEWLNNPNHDEKPNVDEMMLSFIVYMEIFDHIIYKLDGRLSLGRKEELTKEINGLLNAKDQNKGITIRYDKLIEMFRENDYASLFNIIDYFNIFNDNGKLKTYLKKSFQLFKEKEAFNSLINNYKKSEMEYEGKAIFFAYVKYLLLNPNPNQDHLETWMHFVCNVCANSYNIVNTTETFCNAIAGLNYLYDEDIAQELKKKDWSNITTLDKPQIEEEILKMELSSDADWKKVIDEAEKKLCYFEGRLRYPLVECCDIDKSHISDAGKRADFEKYVKKIAAVFPNKDGCNCENELIRAMLSKGNYLMFYNSNNTMLKNAERDNSWRRFLKEELKKYEPFGSTGNDKRSFFKEVIDDVNFDPDNVKESLDKIARARQDSIPEWRKLIIDCTDILEDTDVQTVGINRFIRWNNEATEYSHKKDSEDNYEIVLIRGSAITGYHAELFSLGKYYELKGIEFNSWGFVKYHKAKTSIEQPYFYLGDDSNPFVKVMYQDDNCFRFVFNDGREKTDVASDEIKKELLSMAPIN